MESSLGWQKKLVKINKAGKDRFKKGFGIEAEIGFNFKDFISTE